MQKNVQKIISCFLAVFVLLVAASPAYASGTEYISKDTFWNWASDHTTGFLSTIISYAADDVCSVSQDGRHHASTTLGHCTPVFGTSPYYNCICDDCGKTFTAYETDVKQSYDAYTATLPASSYDSSGQLRWRLNHVGYEAYPRLTVDSFVGGSSYTVLYKTDGASDYLYISVDEFVAPISGDYHLGTFFTSSSPNFYYSNFTSNGNYFLSNTSYISRYRGTGLDVKSGVYYEFPNVVGHSTGETVVGKSSFKTSGNSTAFATVSGYVEVICSPVSLPGGSYDIDSRPTTITGGNYGIIGDNGQITKVENNSTIINETNNTYYNPATGETGTITNWSYDYSDRSYNVTLESGDTVTVTYGDENITIQEGDTVYTVYYITINESGSGSGSGSEPHTHDWRETRVIDATCIQSGKKIYTCSICGETNQETIPALGHDWRVLRTVTNEYDEDGVLVTEGYILYECDRCHEQYKATDTSTRPTPGGGSGTDPGDNDTVLDELPGFVDMVLNLFQQLPRLFSGFVVFLAALFAYIPEEIILLLIFGVAAVVFIGIIKAVRG